MFKTYFLPIFFVLLVSFSGSSITSQGMAWYKTLLLPSLAPAGGFIGLVWTIIYILTTFSFILFAKNETNKSIKRFITLIFILNGVLNAFWSYVFFGLNLVGWAIVEMIILEVINIILFVNLYQSKHKISAYLLLPYILWVAFATYLAYLIYSLNFLSI